MTGKTAWSKIYAEERKTEVKVLKKISKKVLAGAALFTLGSLSALTFMVAPEKPGKELKKPFFGRNIAHRGLHKRSQTIPENSIPAFKAASRIGYGVELDVHLTKDGKVVVFHDDNLQRLCGVDKDIQDLTYLELQEFSLHDTEHKIPLLTEALRAVGRQRPVIVELKQSGNTKALAAKTYKIITEEGAQACVESFDPRSMRWFKKNAPHILRGQLAMPMKDYPETQGRLKSFMLANTMFNFLSRPHFIAYKIGKKPLPVRLSELMGAMKVAWTSREWKHEARNDMVIFEYYRPVVKYK